jgi:hypothetical protein
MSPSGFDRNMYPTTNINTFMERFNIYDTPMSFTRYDDRHWFAHGVMWDLLDNQVDNTSISVRRNGNGSLILNGIIDNCFIGNSTNTNDLSSIFNRLNSNVETTTQFRDALVNQYSSNPTLQNQIRNLFNSYGY